jgi:acetyltransferase
MVGTATVGNEGYEIILGSSIDPQFGPVLLFGAGGQLVEVFRDRALALPPLNTTLARRMMERTRIFQALQGVRGRKPVDLAALEQLVVRFSQLVADQRAVSEIDINPLLVSANGFLALDARVVLHPADLSERDFPKPAIAPYPSQYIRSFALKDGTTVTLRPIRPEDEVEMVKFHQSLSDKSVHARYFHMVNLNERVAHDRLVRGCFIDYAREMALVAELSDSSIVAVGRLMPQYDEAGAEFAIIVGDRFQRLGLGTELLRELLGVARCEGIGRVAGDILGDNCGMLRVCSKLGFRFHFEDKEAVKAEIDVNDGVRSGAGGQ